MAGAFIAIGACVSALTKNQVIAFVVGAAACFLFLMSGVELVLAAFRPWAPPAVVDAAARIIEQRRTGALLWAPTCYSSGPNA